LELNYPPTPFVGIREVVVETSLSRLELNYPPTSRRGDSGKIVPPANQKEMRGPVPVRTGTALD